MSAKKSAKKSDKKKDKGRTHIFRNFKEKMRYMHKTAIATDFKFLVGNDEESMAVFSAHSFMLATSSPFFEALCNSEEDDSKNIRILDYNPRIFKEILRFIYTDDVHITSDSDFVSTYKMAKDFEIFALVKECKEYAANYPIDRENVTFWLTAARTLDDPSIRNRCFDYVEAFTDEIINDKSFCDILPTTLSLVMSTLDIRLESEVVMLRALCKWVRCNEGKGEFSHKTPKQIFNEYLRFIHFPSLAAHEFYHITNQYPSYFRDEEICDGFEVIADPQVEDTPEWMKRKLPRRLPDEPPEVNDIPRPNVTLETYIFYIPIEQEETQIELNVLETSLKAVPKEPLILIGFTIICPNTGKEETAKLTWQIYTFGFYEPVLNEMEFEGNVLVENNCIKVDLPEFIAMDSSLTFVLSILVRYENVKEFHIPYLVKAPQHSPVFDSYGRSRLFEGTAIVSQLHYI